MRLAVTIVAILITLTSRVQVIAQVTDVLQLARDSVDMLSIADTVKHFEDGYLPKLNNLDSLSTGMRSKVHKQIDTVARMNDAIERSSNQIEKKRDNILDSVNIFQTQRLPTKQYDSLTTVLQDFQTQLHTNAMTSKIDSLKKLDLPHEQYSERLDSLENLKMFNKIKSGVIEKQSQATSASQEQINSVNEKLKIFSKESEGHGNMPEGIGPVNKNFGIDELNTNVPEVSVIEKATIPELNIPSTENLPALETVSVPAINGQDIKLDNQLAIPDYEIGTLNKNIETPALPNNIEGNVSRQMEKVADVSEVKLEEVNTLDEVNTSEQRLMAELPVKNELTEIQKQDQVIKEQTENIKPSKDPDAYKKYIVQRSRKIIAEQVALNQQYLEESIQKVSKYQRKMGTILNRSKDLPEKRDPLRKLKKIERIVPGISFQIQKSDAWIVDVNPSLRYRITSYWSAGAGWNERMTFGKHSIQKGNSRVFGARSFTEVTIFKGLGVKLEAEKMNTYVPYFSNFRDEGLRIWEWNFWAGLKKEFTFINKLTGNVQFLYLAYSSHTYNIYPKKFNVRFGFEYRIKKKK